MKSNKDIIDEWKWCKKKKEKNRDNIAKEKAKENNENIRDWIK